MFRVYVKVLACRLRLIASELANQKFEIKMIALTKKTMKLKNLLK